MNSIDREGTASAANESEETVTVVTISIKRRRDECDEDLKSYLDDIDETHPKCVESSLGAPCPVAASLLSETTTTTTTDLTAATIGSDCCSRSVSKLPKRECAPDATARGSTVTHGTERRLPLASTIDDFLQPGGPSRYRPRPEWLFHSSPQQQQQQQQHPSSDDGEESASVRADADVSETRSTPMPRSRDKNTVFGKSWDSLLHVAIRENATEAALALIEIATCQSSQTLGNYSVVLEAINTKGVTPLILAAQKGNVAVVHALLSRAVDPTAACFNGNTAALQAAHFGHAAVLKLLVQADGSRTWSEGGSGGTASGSGSIGQAIIEAANVHHTTPLMRAAQEGHELAVQILLRAGAVSNRRNRSHMTALMLSAQRGHVNVCRQLIQAGADMNMASDKQQSTALMLACKRRKINVVRALVTAGCDLWGTNHRGQTAQQIVKQEQVRQVARASMLDPSLASLVQLLEPETQVSLMRETCGRLRRWELIRAWTLLQQDRALVAVCDSVGVSMDTALLMYKFHVSSSSRPPTLFENFQNSSAQALIRTMTLPAPLVQMIALFLPLPKLWSSRLSMLQSTCLANPNAGVTMTLDFIDEVLEESGFLEACFAANVPPPVPFHSWQAWKRNGQCIDKRVDLDFAVVSTAVQTRPPLETLRVTDATNPRPRDGTNPTRVELRRQVGYLPLLAENVSTLGIDVLTKRPFYLPMILLQQLVRIADVVSLTRRMQGQGIHFSMHVATDLMLLARRLTWWYDNRERQSDA